MVHPPRQIPIEFQDAVELVLALEGYYSNDPTDPGAETKYGISKKAYPEVDIKNMTRDDAIRIYRADYWDKCKCSQLPERMRLPVFDCAVNQGVVTASKILQGLLGVTKDGVIGTKTLEAANRLNTDVLFRAYLVERLLQYQQLSHFDIYGRGWFHRVMKISAFCY